MIITNKYNIDEVIYKTIVKNKSLHKRADISATELIKPVIEIVLMRKYGDLLEVDARDMLKANFGTSMHYLFENTLKDDKDYKTETYLEAEVDGVKISGTVDLYHIPTKTIRDYKFTNIYKYKKKDYIDWEYQLNIYRYLMNVNGYEVDKLQISAYFVNWSLSEYLKNKDEYPPAPNVLIDIDMWDFEDIKTFIQEKVALYKEYMNKEITSIPVCSKEDRWEDDDKYLVYRKEGQKRPSYIFDNEEEAKKKAEEIKGFYEVKRGIPKKCIYFCNVNKFCPYYNSVVKHKFEKEIQELEEYKRG